MADLQEFKCPNCGGSMEFDPSLQQLKCPYCDTVISIDEYQKLNQEPDIPPAPPEESRTWDDEETKHLRLYVCNSCGGEIVAHESLGASSCPFCGNPVVMKGQFTGDLKPDYVIPFKLNKDQAKQKYMQHLQGKPFLPDIFRDENHIDEIKGIYVPFWLVDADVDADIQYAATTTRSWSDARYRYTETKHYVLDREGSVSFSNVPKDASKEIDDAMMESIEPFDMSEAVSFQTAYLAGYFANRYDEQINESMERIRQRVKTSTESIFRDSTSGFGAVVVQSSRVNLNNTSYRYVLYPVWLLNTTWNDQHFHFAMNGQTGKFVGNLPADNRAYWKFVVLWGIVIALGIYALLWAILLI